MTLCLAGMCSSPRLGPQRKTVVDATKGIRSVTRCSNLYQNESVAYPPPQRGPNPSKKKRRLNGQGTVAIAKLIWHSTYEKPSLRNVVFVWRRAIEGNSGLNPPLSRNLEEALYKFKMGECYVTLNHSCCELVDKLRSNNNYQCYYQGYDRCT